MYRLSLIMSVLILLGIFLAWVWLQEPLPATAPPAIDLQDILATAGAQDFDRATVARPFQFPRDHGPHLSFKNEWWYLTGNIVSADGREFGYQFTLFRDGLVKGTVQRPSDWATGQTYMAHFALADISAGRFFSFERFSRAAMNLAGAEIPPGRFWLEDWVLTIDGHSQRPTLTLATREGNIALSLTLTAEKPPVLHGDHGLSRKGDQPGQATYYYSYTRLKTTGQLVLNKETFAVKGNSWFDREWGTDVMSRHISGWDWFSLQFDDGREFMYYQLRTQDGAPDPCSRGSWIEVDGSCHGVGADEIQIEILEEWQDEAGNRYPGAWRMRWPHESCELVIQPKMQDQLLRTSIRYWEGAVRFAGTRKGVRVTGQGYVELTGYTKTVTAAPEW